MTRHLPKRILLLPALALTILFLLESSLVQSGIQEGARLAYMSVIPSVFPFAVLSSYIIGCISNEETPGFLRPIEKILALPSGGGICFLIGLFCGFPLGAKCVADGYRQGLFDKHDAERMLMFSNNTGPAFLIGAVGGMFGSAKYGWLLFGVQLLLVLCTALVTRKKHCEISRVRISPGNTQVSFANVVTSASTATLSILGFVMFFSAILSVASHFLPETMLLPLACILEVSTGVKLCSRHPLGLAFAAFCIQFSGISVMLQSCAMLDGTDLSMRKSIIAKICSGLIAFSLVLLIMELTSVF